LSLAEQARLLNEVGWLQYRLGDYSSCVDSCKFTVNTINPNEHPLIVAQALNLLGVIAFNTSRYDEAVSYYEQSAFLRERENDLNALAGSYNNLALAYQAKGEYDKALGYLHKSIDIKRKQNNEAGLAGGFLNLASLYLEVHNFDEADRRCRESLRISSELGLAQLIAENYNTLGDILFTRGQLDEAEAYYRRSLEHAHRLSTVNEEMGAQKRLARLYIRKGRHDDARAAIEEASRLARQVGSKYEQAQTEDTFGELKAAESSHAEAVDHFEKAATLYATLSKHRMAAACLAKAGIAYADAITTVSPRYAREITTEAYGFGLDGLLRQRQNAFVGILNGIDEEEWTTIGNPYLQHSYDRRNLNGKMSEKVSLQRELGLPEAPHIPLFGTITRLVPQKGVDLLLGALEEMLAGEMQFVLLGSGEPAYEAAFRNLAQLYPNKAAIRIGYDQVLSHRIEAACDFYLMPSRFEPCGLNQMYSLRYGAIPIVRQTGGLDDSVIDPTESVDHANGIKFVEPSVRALAKAIRKALVLYKDAELLKHFRTNAMAENFSWARSAGEYEKVYEEMLVRPGAVLKARR
jgi:glycosyltransferase involved in cell wall biosynthesis